MNELIKIATKEIARLEKMLIKIEQFLANAPDGCLKWQKKNMNLYYYHQYKDYDRDKWCRKFLGAEKLPFAKKLAKKHYYISMRNTIRKRLDVLKKFVRAYPDQEIEDVYEALCEERKQLLEPIETTIRDRVNAWKEEVYERNNSYPESLKYETDQGEMVRSKSEVIIANLLHKYQKDLLYKYERPLQMIVGGRTKTIYPDFTIINRRTGKIWYWEHAGMMDDPHYATEFVKKINGYAQNDLLLGRDVVVTFETQENGLDMGVVKKVLEVMLNF